MPAQHPYTPTLMLIICHGNKYHMFLSKTCAFFNQYFSTDDDGNNDSDLPLSANKLNLQ